MYKILSLRIKLTKIVIVSIDSYIDIHSSSFLLFFFNQDKKKKEKTLTAHIKLVPIINFENQNLQKFKKKIF